MSGRLAALSVIATLALAGAGIACPMEQSAANGQTMVTASAPAQTPATGTTTPKTPEAEIGG